MTFKPLFTFFYDCCLGALSLAMLPKLLYMRFFHNKYKNSLAQRFGFNFPIIEKNGRKLIWIHAVSVGEARAVTPLAKQLKEQEPQAIILISSITETGHAEAKRAIPFADYHVFLPVDFSPIIRSVLAKARPDLVILCESDFWYQFISQAKKGGAQVLLVNGKISDRSSKRFQFFKNFAHLLFSQFDKLCVQNDTYKKRFESLGVQPSKIVVTGNMKFDDRGHKLEGEDLTKWKQKLGIKDEDRVIVIGSTHAPEEKIIAHFIPALLSKFRNLKVLIVPRHPERFNAVAALLHGQEIPFQRYSQEGPLNAHVVLVDSMGLLRNCYQIATLAIVGGSFTNHVGGHNILEPLWYQVPVIYGPHMFSQPDLVELVGNSKAGIQVSSDRLEETIQQFLEDHKFSRDITQFGKELVNSLQGSIGRTWEIIRSLR